MKKTYTIVLCLVIVVCLGIGIYCNFNREQRGLDYEISFIERLNAFVFSPLSWVCTGMLIGSILNIGKRIPAAFRRSMKILAILFVLMYACAVIVYALPVSAGSIYILTAWCIAHPSAFILPGLLYGLSMTQDA